jgi:hypothetical protein
MKIPALPTPGNLYWVFFFSGVLGFLTSCLFIYESTRDLQLKSMEMQRKHRVLELQLKGKRSTEKEFLLINQEMQSDLDLLEYQLSDLYFRKKVFDIAFWSSGAPIIYGFLAWAIRYQRPQDLLMKRDALLAVKQIHDLQPTALC